MKKKVWISGGLALVLIGSSATIILTNFPKHHQTSNPPKVNPLWPNYDHQYDFDWNAILPQNKMVINPYGDDAYSGLMNRNYHLMNKSTSDSVALKLQTALNPLVNIGLIMSDGTNQIDSNALNLTFLNQSITKIVKDNQQSPNQKKYKSKNSNIFYSATELKTAFDNLKTTLYSNNKITLRYYSRKPQKNNGSSYDLSGIYKTITFSGFSPTTTGIIENSFAYNTGKLTLKNNKYVGGFDHDYRVAGYHISAQDNQYAYDLDTNKDKRYFMSVINDQNKADGFLYFSPASIASYNKTPATNGQIKTHLYLEPTIQWNTKNNNGFNKRFIANHNKIEFNGIIMPSIFEDVLDVANLHTNHTSYYSYGSDNNLNDYNDMGMMNIKSDLTKTGSTWETQTGLFSTINNTDNASGPRTTNDSTLFYPGSDVDKNVYPNQINNSFPITNTKVVSGKNYQVWGSDVVGDPDYNIRVPFKIINYNNF